MLSRHCFHAVWFSSFQRYGPNKLLYKPLRPRYFVIVAESRPKQEVPDWRGVMMCPWDYSRSSWHWVLSCLAPCFPDGSQQVVWCFSEDHDEDTDSFKRKKKHDFPSASLFVKETTLCIDARLRHFLKEWCTDPGVMESLRVGGATEGAAVIDCPFVLLFHTTFLGSDHSWSNLDSPSLLWFPRVQSPICTPFQETRLHSGGHRFDPLSFK